MPEKLLEIDHITKIFPGVKALDNVHFDLYPGEIHALAGENGAGKSTFIKVLAGVHQPDTGEIFINGKLTQIENPQAAEALGIATIHQHAASYPDLSVAENIFIGHEFMKFGVIDWRRTRAEAKRLLDSIGGGISPTDTVKTLSVAKQQMVEIAKALSMNAKVLIMDEPTAALSNRESEELYDIARKLRDQGTAIILISHRFEDIYGLADRVTVLRDGCYIGTWPIAQADKTQLVEHMVGRDIGELFPKKEVQIGEELLRIEHFSRTGYFKDINLNIHAGEIVGLTGLVGARRSEVVEAVFGVTPHDSGKVYFRGKEVHITSPTDAMNLGISLLPEDRQIQGLLLDWSIKRNISMPSLDKCKAGIFLSDNKETSLAEKYKEMLRIKTPNVGVPASSLSGGNQQKVVIGKLLGTDPHLLILDEPTKGVDVGSKAAIYEIMSDLAAQGIGILMISSEMPEVINMSDRIYVMREGRMSFEFREKGVEQTAILEAAMPAVLH